MKAKNTKSRQVVAVLLVGLLVAGLTMAACARATPTPTPTQPTPTAPPAATPTRPPAATPTSPPAATPTRPPAATPTRPPAATPTPAKTAQEQAYERALAEFKQIEEAGKKEGKVVLYTISAPATSTLEVEAFRKDYPGIALEFVQMPAATAIERIKAEVSTGKQIASVFPSGIDSLRTAEAGGNFYERWLPPNLLDPRVEWLLHPDVDGTAILVHSVLRYYMVVNTKLVPKADEPQSWADLIDPKWKGKIVHYDPRIRGSGNYLFVSYTSAYGEDFAKKFLANSTLSSHVTDSALAVVRGEFAINPAFAVSSFFDVAPEALQQGLVKFLVPKEGMFIILSGNMLVKGAPHPNAAKVYLNWKLGRNGQIFMGTRNAPAMKGIEPKYKELSLEGAKLLPGQPFSRKFELEEFPKYFAIADRILKEIGK